MSGEGRRGNSRLGTEEELGNRRHPAPPASAPVRNRAGSQTTKGVSPPGEPGARRRGRRNDRAAFERSRAHGPAGMALTLAPAPGQTALPSTQWPPPTSGRPCQPGSHHCSGAPEDQRVGGATSRKCPLLQSLPETPLAGTAWCSCLQAEPRVARQPVRARQTRSKFPGETLLYQQPAAGATSRPARFPESRVLSGRISPALGTTYPSPATTTP